jgi:hypothetical protein
MVLGNYDRILQENLNFLLNDYIPYRHLILSHPLAYTLGT